MATLYEIDEAIRNFEYEIDEETGEILNPYALDDLMLEREYKLENIACFIKELRADVDAIKGEIGALKERAGAREKKADNLKKYLDYALQGNPFSTPRCEVTYRKSKSTEIIDIKKIPTKYINKVVDLKPDKTAIKKAIEGGEKIEGARVIENNNIHIK